MTDYSYICSICESVVPLAMSTARRHNRANPEKVCRTCRRRGKLQAHIDEYQINEQGRKCKSCGELKLWEEFPGRYARLGKVVNCNDCLMVNFKSKWGKDKKYTESIRASGWRSHLKRNYDLTVEQYEAMKREQDNKCAVCATTPIDKLCVDHCHTTGKIRKLLCRNCNKALGILKDSPDLLRKAAIYLETA